MPWISFIIFANIANPFQNRDHGRGTPCTPQMPKAITAQKDASRLAAHAAESRASNAATHALGDATLLLAQQQEAIRQQVRGVEDQFGASRAVQL